MKIEIRNGTVELSPGCALRRTCPTRRRTGRSSSVPTRRQSTCPSSPTADSSSSAAQNVSGQSVSQSQSWVKITTFDLDLQVRLFRFRFRFHFRFRAGSVLNFRLITVLRFFTVPSNLSNSASCKFGSWVESTQAKPWLKPWLKPSLKSYFLTNLLIIELKFHELAWFN